MEAETVCSLMEAEPGVPDSASGFRNWSLGREPEPCRVIEIVSAVGDPDGAMFDEGPVAAEEPYRHRTSARGELDDGELLPRLRHPERLYIGPVTTIGRGRHHLEGRRR